MQSDDQFRLAYDAAIGRLEAWAIQQNDAAQVVTERVGDFWRLSVWPAAANACPVELILHRDTQTYDLQVAAEVYEGRRIDAFDDFIPLLAAVVDGRVVIRTTASVNGGAVRTIETIIQPQDRVALILGRQTAAGARLPDEAVVVRDRHWVPYRR